MRKTEFVVGCFVVVSASGAGAQSAFVEDFEGGLSGWTGGDGLTPVVESDGLNSYVSVTSAVPSADGAPFPAFTLLGGLAANNASGGAFVGDYLSAGIDELRFDVRHNADQALTFTLRVATAQNFPSFIVFSPVEVAAGDEFTTLSYSFEAGNPFFFPDLDPFAVLPSVGNIQLLVDSPLVATADDVTFNFDNIAIVPAPGAGVVMGLAGLVVARRRVV